MLVVGALVVVGRGRVVLVVAGAVVLVLGAGTVVVLSGRVVVVVGSGLVSHGMARVPSTTVLGLVPPPTVTTATAVRPGAPSGFVPVAMSVYTPSVSGVHVQEAWWSSSGSSKTISSSSWPSMRSVRPETDDVEGERREGLVQGGGGVPGGPAVTETLGEECGLAVPGAGGQCDETAAGRGPQPALQPWAPDRPHRVGAARADRSAPFALAARLDRSIRGGG